MDKKPISAKKAGLRVHKIRHPQEQFRPQHTNENAYAAYLTEVTTETNKGTLKGIPMGILADILRSTCKTQSEYIEISNILYSVYYRLRRDGHTGGKIAIPTTYYSRLKNAVQNNIKTTKGFD